MSNEIQSPGRRRWSLLSSLSGYRAGHLGADLAAGALVAAIAVPEQMATARLGGFSPEMGFHAFVAGTIGFALFGANRVLSVGADSTITPIFASSLGLIAASGTPVDAGLAATLSLMVGIIMVLAGLLRLGWIADLLSMPVTTGFLAGIGVHIALSQLPGMLGIPATAGGLPLSIGSILRELGGTNTYTLVIGLAVLGISLGADRWNARIPGALIGLAGATVAVLVFDLGRHGVAVLGPVPGGLPSLSLPNPAFDRLGSLIPLAGLVALVAMVQTAATTRSFPTVRGERPTVNQDFVGVGAGNLVSAVFGAFPVNTSPPRTGVTVEAGGRSQIAGLTAAALVLAVTYAGSGMLAPVPEAALAGILLFIAVRIMRLRTIIEICRNTRAEFLLVVATIVAIVLLPIESGVAIGVVLSLMHGMWTTTRAIPVEFERIPGTTIWWVPNPELKGEILPGIVVVAFQAPLSFLNADEFQRGMHAAITRRSEPMRLVVLEASSIVAIDYTASRALAEVIEHCRSQRIGFAVARLESARAQEAFRRFGLLDLLGPDQLFHSVDEAVRQSANR